MTKTILSVCLVAIYGTVFGAQRAPIVDALKKIRNGKYNNSTSNVLPPIVLPEPTKSEMEELRRFCIDNEATELLKSQPQGSSLTRVQAELMAAMMLNNMPATEMCLEKAKTLSFKIYDQRLKVYLPAFFKIIHMATLYEGTKNYGSEDLLPLVVKRGYVTLEMLQEKLSAFGKFKGGTYIEYVQFYTGKKDNALVQYLRNLINDLTVKDKTETVSKVADADQAKKDTAVKVVDQESVILTSDMLQRDALLSAGFDIRFINYMEKNISGMIGRVAHIKDLTLHFASLFTAWTLTDNLIPTPEKVMQQFNAAIKIFLGACGFTKEVIERYA